MTDEARLGPKTAATKMTARADGTYFMYVRFERNLQEDIKHRVAQDALSNGASGDEALVDQFKAELGDLSNEGPSAWEVIHGPTADDDPTSVFEIDTERTGRPWSLREYMRAARTVTLRFSGALEKLGLPVDPELRAAIDRVTETGFDDLVETGAQALHDKIDDVQHQYDALVEKVRTAYSSAQSVVSEIEDALPSWARDSRR